MADIFISYTHEDLSAARRLRGALMREGWSVWWDESLQAGRNFNDAIEAALRRARCAIVLWSRRSLASEYVRQEAGLALHLQRLLPVAIERLDLQADLTAAVQGPSHVGAIRMGRQESRRAVRRARRADSYLGGGAATHRRRSRRER